jgi:16S rRNA (cytosine1402-N4)-methyltransferase
MIQAQHGHDPVLPEAVLEYLAPQPGEVFVDCTVGRGGHSMLLAERLGPTGTLLALDADPVNLTYARQRLATLPAGPTTRFFHANFAEIDDVLAAAGIAQVDGLLADLGISTNQLLDHKHGLSFAEDTALDMRLDPRIKRTAADLLAELSERAIADLLFQNAQERMSFRIARKIIQTRATEPIRTTGQLARLVRSVVPGRPGQIDPATRTFQALRMAVNQETESLEDLLANLPEVVRPGGRAVIISFHSGEDRLVKQALRGWAQEGRCALLTRKPREPDDSELSRNPRSRSAKLRALRMLEPLRTDALPAH